MTAQATGNEMHTKEHIKRIAAALEAAPAPERALTKAEALEILAPSLKAARDKGHTIDSLVQQLMHQGMQVSARAVGRAIASAADKKGARGRKPKSSPTAGSLPDDVQRRVQLEAAGQQRLDSQ
ncbi:MAG: hypothetical protein VW475_09095 [Curvibacter sp.]